MAVVVFGLRRFQDGRARRSPLTRLRPICVAMPLGVIVLGSASLGLAIVAIPERAFAQSQAQISAANTQTYFDGVPLGRNRDDAKKFANVPPSGAGKTGFDSSNARKPFPRNGRPGGIYDEFDSRT